MLCDGKNAVVEHLQWCGQVKFLLLCHLMVFRLIQWQCWRVYILLC